MNTLNKKLSVVTVVMFFLAVISFAFKNGETNFNLGKTDDFYGPIISEGNLKKNLTVRILLDGQPITMELENYIIGVVAGEMPASFEVEALKAQAVASRTYALYKKKVNENELYDLTSNTNNQVYLTEEKMHSKWGDDYQLYYNKIKEAVMDTKGEVLTYYGNIIEAFYFAMSAGNTLESASVFNENREYLKSVESKYDNKDLKNYEVTVDFNYEEFKSKLGLTCENNSIDKINYNSIGYVDDITVCGSIFKGTDFRSKLGLRSTNFEIHLGEKVSITTRGYGHGVGMSQYGANGYANSGYSYEDILKHYYTGVEITNIKDV